VLPDRTSRKEETVPPIEPGPRGERIRAFRGFSEYNEESTAQSLHQAIQEAAREAARVLGEEGEALPQLFDLSQVQVLVGNPNVKFYAATLTQAQGDGS
jgi:hypothetical protein